ncbi:MAG: glycerol-3-phosphate 1-O-acyltransferase PlsY [Phycisphaerales bacterium JB065]
MITWIIAMLVAYAIGGIPFGLLLGLTQGVDIREHGSGNIGATNTMRVLGKRLGLTAFLLDVAKGAVPVLIWGYIISAASKPDLPAPEAFKWLGIGVATVLGHMFPIYLRFKGGKGVATGFGMFLGFWPWVTPAAVLALLAWIVCLKTTRYVSVSSIAGACVLPVAILGFAFSPWPTGSQPEGVWPFVVVGLLVAVLVVVKHRSNLARLKAGTEPKVGQRKTPSTGPDKSAD